MSRLLTAKEAADRLRCSLSTAYALCQSGRLRHHRVGLRRGSVRIPEDAIEEYLASTAERAPPKEQLRHLRL